MIQLKIKNLKIKINQSKPGDLLVCLKTAKRPGSALLVAILVMGVLMTLTLGLSSLVIREISQTTDLVAAGKAYFAAEAGVESAMLDLQEHLPGYEVACEDGKNNWADVQGQAAAQTAGGDGGAGSVSSDGGSGNASGPGAAGSSDFHYRYRICNKGNSYPYFDKDKPVFLNPGVGITRDALYQQNTAATYNVLPLNQTVTIPLFVDNGDGTVTDVHSFLLQYYVDFKLDPTEASGQFNGLKLEDFDVLRWKIFGQPQSGSDTAKTESISDFFPAKTGDSEFAPVCIGSDSSLLTDSNLLAGSNCIVPVISFVNGKDSKATFEDLPITNVWSQARECYTNDAGFGVGAVNPDTGIAKGCSIENFVNSHTKNYLTLTNVVNPDIVGISNLDLRYKKANIYYRILSKADAATPTSTAVDVNSEKVLPREYAQISADGFASTDKVKQSIDVKFKLNSFLPVFNFSLYKTDSSTNNQ